MANYDIALSTSEPINIISQELIHIIAHFANEGMTVTSFTILDSPTLRLRIVSPGSPSQKVKDHFGIT